MRLYILDNKLAIPCDDFLQWSRWMESADRVVRKTQLGELEVSTVFLGVDHQHGDGEPLVFETMVFGVDGPVATFKGSLDRDSFWGGARRDSFWGEAEQTHQRAVADIRARLEEAGSSVAAMLASLCSPPAVGC